MYVIKKDHTHEAWNVQKVVVAVNKSAYRAMVKFTQEELDFICSFVEEKARSLGREGIPIAEMHNIVEAALEQVKPEVAKSYRDYRNYKQDFVKMLEENGFVLRRRSESDRRAVEVYPTQKAEETLSAVRAVYRSWREKLFYDLTSEERDRLESLLERLARRAEDIQ